MIKVPSIKILSAKLELLGEFDNYTSLQFKRSWQSTGSFEIHFVERSPPQAMAVGNIIMIDNDTNRCGQINYCQQQHSKVGIELVVKGLTLNGIMAQRIVMPYTDKANKGYFCVPKKVDGQVVVPVAAETILKTFVRGQFPDTATDPRYIPLTIPEDQQRGLKTVWLSRYDQLDTVLTDVCEYCDCGYTVYPDLATKSFVFDIALGIDRSANQNINSRVIMSTDFESISDITYLHDISTFKNVGYAGGAGDDEDRIVLAVTNDDNMPTGLERYETFLDCGTLEAAETDESLSLADEGKHKLQDSKPKKSLTATAQSGSFIYRKNWDLGDLVTVCDKALNIFADKRITEVQETYEPNKIDIIPTFGTAPEHLNRVIQKLLPQTR